MRESLFRPWATEKMTMWPVSRDVGKSENDYPEILTDISWTFR